MMMSLTAPILPIAMITPIVLEVAQQQPFQQRRWLMEGIEAAEVAEKKAEMNIRNQERFIMQQALLEMQREQALEKVGAHVRALSTLSLPMPAPSCHCYFLTFTLPSSVSGSLHGRGHTQHCCCGQRSCTKGGGGSCTECCIVLIRIARQATKDKAAQQATQS